MPIQGLKFDSIMRRVGIPDENDCWPWEGTIDPAGYGRGSFGGVTAMAHRAVYLLIKGDIPQGFDLDHLCRNRRCVNPDHLEPVTHHENCRRGKQAQQTHCVNGHEFNEGNTLIRYRADKVTTYRQCRSCVSERASRQDQRGRYAQRKAREQAKKQSVA